MSEESILSEQEVPEETTTEAVTETTETTEAAPEGWMMSDEVKGEGDVPEWFKTGKYKTVADQAKDPMLVSFNEWAAEAGLSQEKHTELMGIYFNGMVDSVPSVEDEIKRIGKDAPQRINDFTSWAKTNFDEAEYQALETLVTTAEGFNVLEKMRGMLRETDVAAPSSNTTIDSTTKEALYELVADPKYQESPSFRKEVDAKFEAFFGKQAQNEIRQ